MSGTPPRDLRSDKLLAALRGYSFRQPWLKEDRLTLGALFDALDAREAEIADLRDVIAVRETTHAREVARLTNELYDARNTGLVPYLKSLVCR